MIEFVLNRLEAAGRFMDFSARVLAALPAAAARPGEVLVQFDRVALRSLWLVTGAGACVGLAAWFQTHRILADYGAESTLPSLMGAAIPVEIGPLLTGLLLAGRMGAGLAAELASMKLNEEIDARLVLGSDPRRRLVAPRALACALAAPLLAVVLAAAALGGGLVAECAAGESSPAVFANRTLDLLRFSAVIPATLKTGLFGFLVGAVACWVGLNAERSSAAVGRAATAGVVQSILTVFAANAVYVPLAQAVTDAIGWID